MRERNMKKAIDFLKRNFKLIIGIAVLVLVIAIFFAVKSKSVGLENGNLQKWTLASVETKLSTVQSLANNTKNADLIVQCVDKMSSFNDSGEFAVRDAVKLCNMGIQLRENN